MSSGTVTTFFISFRLSATSSRVVNFMFGQMRALEGSMNFFSGFSSLSL